MNTKETLARLRHLYTLGQEAVKRTGDRGEHGARMLQELAKEKGEGTTTVNDARRFARYYSPTDFDQLLKHRFADGTPIGWSYVALLLSVRDRRKRTSLERRIVKYDWSIPRLRNEIRKIQPKRSNGYSKFPVCKNIADANLQLQRLSGQWLRWYQQLETVEQGISLSSFPKPIQKELRATGKAMARLLERANSQT